MPNPSDGAWQFYMLVYLLHVPPQLFLLFFFVAFSCSRDLQAEQKKNSNLSLADHAILFAHSLAISKLSLACHYWLIIIDGGELGTDKTLRLAVVCSFSILYLSLCIIRLRVRWRERLKSRVEKCKQASTPDFNLKSRSWDFNCETKICVNRTNRCECQKQTLDKRSESFNSSLISICLLTLKSSTLEST